MPAYMACLPLDLDRLRGREEGELEQMPAHMVCLSLDLDSLGLLGGGYEERLEQLAQTACILLVWDKKLALLGEIEILEMEAGV